MRRFKIKKYCDDSVSTNRYAIFVYDPISNTYVFYMGNLEAAFKNAMITKLQTRGDFIYDETVDIVGQGQGDRSRETNRPDLPGII